MRHIKINRFVWLLLVVVLIMMQFGCQNNSSYSFDDPDIIAYINGEPVYESKMEYYIEIKKAYYTDLLDSSVNGGDTGSVELDPYNEMLNKTYEIELDRMKKVVSYSDVDWENDYLKTFVIHKQLNDFVGEKGEFEEFLNSSVDASIQDALKSGGVETQYYNGASIKVEGVINSVGEKFNLAYEDCVNIVYSDFLRSEFSYQYLVNYFAEEEYEGNKIDWNGSNIEEYTDYMSNVYSQYDVYLDKLLDQAEIVKR